MQCTNGLCQRIHEATVVFELRCPVAFNMWRLLTLHLVDICSPSPKPLRPYIVLERYSNLHRYLDKHPRSRITLASDIEPFAKSHYWTPIPSVEDRVCVKNALQMTLSATKQIITKTFPSTSLSHLATYAAGPLYNGSITCGRFIPSR